MLQFIWIGVVLCHYNPSNVDGRYHYHRKPGKGTPVSRSPSPTTSPVSSPPAASGPPTSGIFDVTRFGAVGDGSTDDTAAFTAAWKAACAVKSGVVLAPAAGVFTITSTIFSGPCEPGLVFQVSRTLVVL